MTEGTRESADSPFNRLTEKRPEDILRVPFGLGGPAIPYIQESALLPCLVWYLFLEYRDQSDRVKQTNALFSCIYQQEFMNEIMETLEKNRTAFACYQAAKKALDAGEIERCQDSSEWFPLAQKREYPEVYTISFLSWAERTGYNIPHYVYPDTDKYQDVFAMGKIARDRENNSFPFLKAEELEYLRKEPLWTLPKAVLYLIGRKSTQDQKKEINYIESHGAAKKIVEYARDAAKTFELRLVDYSPIELNFDQKQREQGTDKIYAAKVKPDEILKWARSLPLNLSVPEMKTEPMSFPTPEFSGKPLTEKVKESIERKSKKTQPEPQKDLLSITFSDMCGEVILNEVFTLARPTPNGQNYKIIRYLIQNPNRFVTLDELEEKALNGKAFDKRLTDFVAQINMNKNLGKLFFETSKDCIRLHNPITAERMAELNIKRIRIETS